MPFFGKSLRRGCGMLRRLLFVFALATLALGGTANSRPIRPTSSSSWWILETDEGCLYMAYLNEATLQQAQKFFRDRISVKWEGTCTPGKLINGSGTLVQITDLIYTTSPPRAGRATNWYNCPMVNGVWNGTCSHRDSYPQGSADYGSYEMRNGCGVRVGDSMCNASPAPPPPPELVEGSQTISAPQPQMILERGPDPSVGNETRSKQKYQDAKGHPCIEEKKREPNETGTYIYIWFHNICGTTITIWYQSPTSKLSSTGAYPYSDSHAVMKAEEMAGFDWWPD